MMKHCLSRLSILCALFAGAASAEPAYDLAQLESLTLAESRGLRASQRQVEAAGHAARAAGAFPNPEIEYLAGTRQGRTVGTEPGDVSSYGLTQPIDPPWRRGPRIDVAQAELAVAQADARGYSADTLARVRQRYYDMLRRQAELRNAEEDRALMENVRGRIALRVETGEAPRFELIKADAEALNAAKTAQGAAVRLAQARSQLRQAVGASLPEPFTLVGQLRDVPALPPLAELRREIVDTSPDLARGRAEMQRAQRQLDLEKAQRLPDLALKASVDNDPDMRAKKIGVVVSIPLWDRRSARIDEASAQLARSREDFEARSFGLQQALEVACQQYEIALTQVNALESGIVRQAEAALKVAEAAYRFGERGFLEVLDAQRVYRAARAELIAARHELASAWVEVERLRAVAGGK